MRMKSIRLIKVRLDIYQAELANKNLSADVHPIIR